MKLSAVWRRRLWVIGVMAACAGLLAATVGSIAVTVDTDSTASLRPTIVIDAGHGDFDGGAVAPDGTTEKALNLAVALPLRDMLTVCGFDVVMTREDDTALHDDDSATLREKKVSDMKARLALYEKADLNVSLHQNMFGAAKYHGAQVFYSTNHPLSKELGESIRSEVVRLLQPDNARELKSGSKDIYLLYRATVPTVLVECGFLSNAEELALLKSEDYQRQMAFAVACGITRYAAVWGKESTV